MCNYYASAICKYIALLLMGTLLYMEDHIYRLRRTKDQVFYPDVHLVLF